MQYFHLVRPTTLPVLVLRLNQIPFLALVIKLGLFYIIVMWLFRKCNSILKSTAGNNHQEVFTIIIKIKWMKHKKCSILAFYVAKCCYSLCTLRYGSTAITIDPFQSFCVITVGFNIISFVQSAICSHLVRLVPHWAVILAFIGLQ